MLVLSSCATPPPAPAPAPAPLPVVIDEPGPVIARGDEFVIVTAEAGDTLEGLIEGARKTDGPFGVQEQVLVRTPEGGLIAVWLTKWLTQQLRANGAELGDLLSLTFHGKELGKSGAAFNRMTVVTLKPDPAV